MEETTNQEVTNYRDQLVGRMKSKYPDRNFDNTDGQNNQNSLEQSVIEALDEYDSNTQRLTDLFNGSTRSAVFLNALASGADPAAAMYKAYGKDAYDAFTSGDASELIASIEAEDAKNRADDEAFEKEKAENLAASFEALDQWGNEKGLSEDEKVEVFMRFYQILSDAIVGKYSPELFEMGWKADHYNDDVEAARKEGEVAGRNANIKAKMAKRKEIESMPPALSGQGVRSTESKPAVEEDNPWML